MAVTLTKNYQRISTISLTYGEIRTYAKYSTQDMTNNRTSYKIKSTYYTWQAGGVSFSSGTSTLDGTTKNYGYTTIYGETTLQELSRTLNHNADGSSPTKNISTSWTATYGGGGSASASIVAPKINRIATVQSAQDFNDETNPTVMFTNPANFQLVPYLAFYKGSTQIKVITRAKGTYTSPYVWELTEEEREELRQICNNANTYGVTEGFDTYSGNTRIGNNSLYKNFTIINANPALATSIKEIDEKAISVLGGNDTEYLIQNISKPQVIATPTTLKYATVKRVEITNGTYQESKSLSPYIFNFTATNGKTTVKATDSRNNSVEETITKTLIPYEPVSINSFSFERQNPTSSNLVLNADIKYYQKTFNETPNVPTVQWMIASSEYGIFPSDDLFPGSNVYPGSTWNTIDPSDYTIDTQNNKIIISNLVLNDLLDYREKGELYLRVNDLLSEYSNHTTVIKGIPTMDMGEHDVCINGELYIADEDRDNKQTIREYVNGQVELWSGSGTATNRDLTLTENIYNFRYVIIVGQWGNKFIIPVIENNTYLNGGMNYPLANGTAMITTGITASITNNGLGVHISYFRQLTNTQNSNHGSFENPELYNIIGIR